MAIAISVGWFRSSNKGIGFLVPLRAPTCGVGHVRSSAERGPQLLIELMGWSVALVGISGAVRGICSPGPGIRGGIYLFFI